MKPDLRLKLARVAAFIFVVGITIYLVTIRDQLQQYQPLGYPGVFLINLISSATVFIPVPGVLVTSAFGIIYNPFWVAICAGLGAGLGELSGYLAGFSGQAVVQKVKWHERLENLMRKYGDIVVVVLAFIPNPLFDVAGITAGALKMPVYRFLVWCILGKILKMLLFSYGGAAILNWFS
jgi:membrane protein DedA with SNARE-associated domain